MQGAAVILTSLRNNRTLKRLTLLVRSTTPNTSAVNSETKQDGSNETVDEEAIQVAMEENKTLEYLQLTVITSP